MAPFQHYRTGGQRKSDIVNTVETLGNKRGWTRVPVMKSAFYTRSGPAVEVLEVGERPLTEPGEGEVRVRLQTSGVNPSDVKSRANLLGRPIAFPLVIPHSDGAGDIDAVGSGIDPSRIGERVWIWNGQWRRAFGTAASHIVLPQQQAAPLPANISYAEGACLGIPALTAFQASHLAGSGPGRTIFVSGGAGAVSHYAIQIAKAAGATVFTTVSGEAKAAHARDAGADAIINYRTEDVGKRVAALTAGRGVDAIIELDITANAQLIPTVLKPHGTVVAYGYSAAASPLPIQWLLQNSVTLRFFLIYDLLPAERAEALKGLGRLLEAGTLRHAIARTFALDDIAAAHEAVESGGTIGNVVIEVG